MNYVWRFIFAAAIAFAAFLVVGCWYAVSKSSEIRSYDERFAVVEYGDHLDTVTELFGAPHRVHAGPRNRYDNDALVKSNDPDIASEYWYTVETFYIPITWAFGVNADGVVISKHRYD